MKKTKVDDLDAVRAVVEALEPFENDARARIIRWAGEKLEFTAPHEEEPAAPRERKTRNRKKAADQPEVGNGGTTRPAGTQDDI